MQVATPWKPPSGTLGELVAAARLRAVRLEVDRDALIDAAHAAPKPPGLRAALRTKAVAVIAEVKRKSPSRGDINPALDAADRASDYAAGGAAAISVLTEPDRFGGSTDDLRAVRARVGLPVLRKDFLIDSLQLIETRALGASAGLIIVRAIEPNRLSDLLTEAWGLGLELLVEVHTAAEVDLALSAGAHVIGVNNRDLESLEVDLTLVHRLIPMLPAEVIAVAESGIQSAADIDRAAAAGADAVLVGTALSAAVDATALVRAMATIPRQPARRRSA